MVIAQPWPHTGNCLLVCYFENMPFCHRTRCFAMLAPLGLGPTAALRGGLSPYRGPQARLARGKRRSRRPDCAPGAEPDY